MTAQTAKHDRQGAADAADDLAFVQDLAALVAPMGMPPIAGRMHGYLLLMSEPVSLDELVAGLGVSKSSASVAARLLERHGVIRRLTEPGTKRVRYAISGRCDGFLAEQVEFLGEMGRLLAQRAAARPDHETSERLRSMGAFFLRLRDAMDKVFEEEGRSA